jgi:YHS domain-containing protein
MEGFLSFLFFAAFFYLMMRVGCGAHMMRGQHGTTDDDASKHIDPVCGKDVPPSEGYGKMHADQLYRFCSRDCLDTFDAEPDRYTTKSIEAKS